MDLEPQRPIAEWLASLFDRLDWVLDRLGDGTGFDALSYDAVDRPRYIDVETTTGPYAPSFVISRNKLDFF